MKDVLGLTPAQFLQRHWQKKLAWGRGWMPLDSIRLETGLLRELATEDDADARLITGPDANDRWDVQYGPFDSQVFDCLPQNGWTLLVQDLEKWLPELESLWSLFAFVPDWRRDDLMISWAAPGGSVGPHVDRYDVFLAQISGKRRWSTGRPGKRLPERHAGELQLCEIDEAEPHPAARPGDVLYLPPGVAHHGVAETECLTMSFGLRAPSMSELLLEFAQDRASLDEAEALYADSDLQLEERGAWLSDAATERLRQMLNRGLKTEDPALDLWVARFLTAFSARRPVPVPSEEFGDDHIRTELRAGRSFQFNPWSRRLGIQTDNGPWIAIDGECYRVSPELAETLLGDGNKQFDGNMDKADLDLLVDLVVSGQLTLGDHD